MVRFFRIRGHSLEPEYQPGDFVMASKIPFLFHPPQKDEVIIFRHPEIGLAIKRIETFDAETDQVTVLGTHSYSIDSRHFGPIPKCLILGKVLWHIHPKR